VTLGNLKGKDPSPKTNYRMFGISWRRS
jgi:hypothetical protein